MSFFQRLKTLFASNANAFLDQVEDPIKLIDLSIEELTARQRETKQTIIKAKTHLKLVKSSDSENESKELLEQIKLLEEQLSVFPERMNQLKQKRTEFHKRILKAQQQNNKALLTSIASEAHDYVNDQTSFEKYDQMVEKIEQNEAYIEALNEVRESDKITISTKESQINSELQALKKKIDQKN